MKTRGQITVIIIMILVMIMIFGTLNYIVGRGAEEKREIAVSTQQLTRNKMAPITDFVTSCLDLATRDAVTRIGKQGGYLYKSQGGPVPDFTEDKLGKEYVRYDGVDVAYAIMPPVGSLPGIFSKTPKYPYPTFPEVYKDGVMRYHFQSYFGWNKLIQVYPPATNNVKEQLEVYITNKLLDCADWDQFVMQNMNISTLEPNVSVRFTRKETVASLKYPINITELSTGSKGYIDTFENRVPVRLKHLFDFMNMLVSEDVVLGNFSVTRASAPGITTKLIPKVHGEDYLVRLADKESSMLDEDYEFQFMVGNRAPALHLVNGTGNQGLTQFVVCATDDDDAVFTIDGDVFTITNPLPCPDPQSISIVLNSTEPDEHNISYQFNIERSLEQGTSARLTGRQAAVLQGQRQSDVEFPQGYMQLNISVSDDGMADYQEMYLATIKVAQT